MREPALMMLGRPHWMMAGLAKDWILLRDRLDCAEAEACVLLLAYMEESVDWANGLMQDARLVDGNVRMAEFWHSFSRWGIARWTDQFGVERLRISSHWVRRKIGDVLGEAIETTAQKFQQKIPRWIYPDGSHAVQNPAWEGP